MFGLIALMVGILLFLLAIIDFYNLQQEGSISKEDLEKKPDEKYGKNRGRVVSMAVKGYASLLIFGGTIPPTNGWDPGFAMVLFIAFHLLASFRVVGAKELGVLLLFNKPLYPVDSGLRFVPWLICSLVRETRLVIEDELPANPEKIHRVARGEPEFVPAELSEKGYRPPLRVTFASNHEKGTEDDVSPDPLKERITAEVPGIVRWQIVDLMVFLIEIGDIENARAQMGDVYESVITLEMGQVTAAEAVQNRGARDEAVKKELEKSTIGWGVKIFTASIKQIIFSHEFNTILQKIPQAQAQRRADMLEGEGLGLREKGILSGRTAGLKEMQKELGINSEAILASETARDVASKVDTLVAVGQGGMADLMGIVTAGAQVLKSSGKNKAGETPKEGGVT